MASKPPPLAMIFVSPFTGCTPAHNTYPHRCHIPRPARIRALGWTLGAPGSDPQTLHADLWVRTPQGLSPTPIGHPRGGLAGILIG